MGKVIRLGLVGLLSIGLSGCIAASGIAMMAASVGGHALLGEALTANAGKAQINAGVLYRSAYWDKPSSHEIGGERWTCASQTVRGYVCVEPAMFNDLNSQYKNNPKALEAKLNRSIMDCEVGKGGAWTRTLSPKYNDWIFCKGWV